MVVVELGAVLVLVLVVEALDSSEPVAQPARTNSEATVRVISFFKVGPSEVVARPILVQDGSLLIGPAVSPRQTLRTEA